MQKFFSLMGFLACSLVAPASIATVDGHTEVFLVVEHIQSGEFFVERAPMIGCYGIAKGPQLVQFTAPYEAPSNVGCGMKPEPYNINALTCATITKTEEAEDFDGFSSLELDLSNCPHKANPDFLKAVEKAAKMNFAPESGKPFQLRIRK